MDALVVLGFRDRRTRCWRGGWAIGVATDHAGLTQPAEIQVILPKPAHLLADLGWSQKAALLKPWLCPP